MRNIIFAHKYTNKSAKGKGRGEKSLSILLCGLPSETTINDFDELSCTEEQKYLFE